MPKEDSGDRQGWSIGHGSGGRTRRLRLERSLADRAMRINAETADALAALVIDLGTRVVHYSSDYGFDGAKARACY